jgi:tetratricopeptide (TPR) repeat protein
VLVQLSKAVTAITIATVLGSGGAWCQTPQWKDRAEYDIVQSINAEKNDAKRLELLDSWKQKYPGTDFKVLRLGHYLNTYKGLNNGAKMLETAKEMVTVDPKNLQGLYWASVLTISLANTAPDALDAGEKAANSLTANLDALKPAGASDEAWKKEKPTLEAIGYKTLGWIAMQRKNNEAAEKAFAKAMEANPNEAQVAFWLGTVILAQKNADRQVEPLFWFARAVTVDGPMALPPDHRKAAEAYFVKLYSTYHGDSSGLDDVKKYATANTKPGPDFKIDSKLEIEAKGDADFAQKSPQKALWKRVKNELTAPNGEQYFAEHVKDTALPKLKGKLISQKPTLRPKELVLAILDDTTAEVTLKLELPPNGAAKADPGTELEFEGTPTAFTKEPFNVTITVEKGKLTGWPVPPPVKKATTTRRPVTKKK